VRSRAIAVASVLAAAIVAGGSAASTRNDAATARLTLDGAALRPEVALTGAQRAVGLMNRTQAPRDGMLFVFRHPTSAGFWMKNTLVPLRIVFFDASGRRVRQLSMTPCRTEVCPTYDPGRVYRFALELPAGDRRPAVRLGPRAALQRLIRRSS
jgi:uncharacterized membrane protein (UPF0127 family)